MDSNQKRQLIETHPHWWHSFDFGDGVKVEGCKKKHILDRELLEWGFSRDLFSGKDVLDVGAWDGFYSFHAEEHDAKSVTALDFTTWTPCENSRETKAGFDIAKRIKQSNVREIYMDIETSEFTPEKIGKYDVIIFAGVLYHLRNPFGILEKLYKLLNPGGIIFIETTCDPYIQKEAKPLIMFHPGNSLNSDSSNYFTFNYSSLKGLVEEFGMTVLSHRVTSENRQIMYAKNNLFEA